MFSTSHRATLAPLIALTLAGIVSGCGKDPEENQQDMSRPADMQRDDMALADMAQDSDVAPPDADLIDMGGDLSSEPDAPADEEMDVPDMEAPAEDMAMMPPCVAPEPGTTTSEGHPSDGWRWVKQGRVFAEDLPDVGAGNGDFSPTIIPEGEGFRLYFGRKRGAGFTLYTSTSDATGMSWSAPVRVTGLDGESYPSALRLEDGSVRMWYGSGSVGVASSQDGVNFTVDQERILTTTQVGELAKISIIYPEVRKNPNGANYSMWFTGFSGQAMKLGVARSLDAEGLSWTTTGAAALEASGGTDFDSKSVAQPEVHHIEGTSYMWYGGYDTSKTDPGPWRIGLAKSVNDGPWERVGVTMPLSEQGDDMWSTRDPAVIQRADGTWLMVYVGMRDDSVYRLLTATSDACLTP